MINYHRGYVNDNADALSRKLYPDTQLIAATSQIPVLTEIFHEHQLTDPVIQELHSAYGQTSSNHALPQGPIPLQTIMHQTHNYLLSQFHLSLLVSVSKLDKTTPCFSVTWAFGI